MASNMRNAASLLLLANAKSFNGNNLKVLMIKRHTKARFMASLYVFPGGVLETQDGTVGTADNVAHINAFRRGAIRELWEETSVAIDANGAVAGRAAAPDYSCEESVLPFAHWITPVHEKYRYDTWFFAKDVANDEEALRLDMKACPNELADLKWLEPKEALEMHANDSDDSFRVPPPTFVFLDWLAKHQNSQQFMNTISCYKHDPIVSVPEVLPVYDNPAAENGRIKIGSNKLHLPDGEFHTRLSNFPGVFCIGDKYVQ